MLESRRAATVWIWEHKFGLHKLLRSELIRLLHPKGRIEEPYPFDATIKGWNGDELQVSLGWGQDDAGSALIGWDLAKHKWRIIERESQKQPQ